MLTGWVLFFSLVLFIDHIHSHVYYLISHGLGFVLFPFLHDDSYL